MRAHTHTRVRVHARTHTDTRNVKEKKWPPKFIPYPSSLFGEWHTWPIEN